MLRGVKKLKPRFIGLYKTLKHIGSQAYKLAVLPSLVKLHDVFHVSLLHHYCQLGDG